MRLPGLVLPLLLAAASVVSQARAQETTIDLSGEVEEGGPDHVRFPFEVPEGTAEIEIEHLPLGEDVLDWGLEDPSGFRGWGGGNRENVIVNEEAASRSYLTGPIEAGTWSLIVGKALLETSPAAFSATVTLREEATLPPQEERTPYQPSAPLEEGARWYAGDFHVHSMESGDARPPVDEVAEFARSRGLDFVELSDHNTTSQLDFIVDAQSRHPALLLMPGVEYTTYDGHANGVGATAFVDHKIGLDGLAIEDALDAFDAQGAIFSINHPTLDLGTLCIGCMWAHEVPADRIGAVEIATGGAYPFFMDSAIAFWDELCDTGAHVAAIGGSDDHRAGVDLNAVQDPIGEPTTMVFADRLDTASIVEGVRRGLTVVRITPEDAMATITSDPPADGDSIAARRAILTATVTGEVLDGTVVRFVKNGEPQEEIEIEADPFTTTVEVTPPASGEDRWRVEVLEGPQRRVVTSHLWIADGPAEPQGGTTSSSSGSTGTAGGGDDGAAAEGGGCGCEAPGAPRSLAGSFAVLLAIAALAARARRSEA